ncbi:hypothetical protein AM501_15300 [Aneurinibacillus migulanus]|uniref:DUF6470 family protein n=1 Tax=Aneurinibacillus migulanus TaxID=47500 RepID=UPI0005B878FB|nr:DUF6470 family protein [Aneurinibacillus migulanus]KIV53494.1 hypothetical protein TS64_18825 [Aneurinibacillus migulanus]KPD07411.1 hypothetical protein AM501_15300 [Aneurinibacillus migulanus]MCP1357788.1 DUF6470 family protein [Aneurinibacillus migulanus]CEH30603.1 Uncharacterized protein BN1090_A2_03056 [Aneurinibacillus migulanus]
MNLPRIQLNQTFYKLGWDTQQPSYSFNPSRATLSIEQKPAEMVLNPTPPRVLIDQTECWADMDLKHIFRRNAEFASYGKQQVLQYISRVMQEGEQLRAIENKGNAIASIAKSKKLIPDHQFTYRNVPGNFSLKMQGVPGALNMEWREGEITVDVQQTPFEHHYEKGKITYHTLQKNRLDIDVIGGTIDIAK